MKKYILNIILIFTSVVGTLFFVEVALQFNHFVKFKKMDHAQLQPSEGNIYKIVTIGESTTAPTLQYDRDISWPKQLEEQLNKALHSKIEVQITNLAEAGVASPYLIKKLRTQIKQIKPDLIISMMGINDSVVPRYLQERDELKITKILKLSLETIHNKFKFGRYSLKELPKNCSAQPVSYSPDEIDKLLTIIKEPHDNMSDLLSQLTNNDPIKECLLGAYLYQKRQEVNQERNPKKRLIFQDTALEFLSKSLRHGNINHVTIFYQVQLLVVSRQFNQCSDLILNALNKGYKLNSSIEPGMLLCYKYSSDKYKRSEVLKSYLTHLNIHTLVDGLSATRESYFQLKSLVDEYKIKWVLMQYPLTKIDYLKAMLDGDNPYRERLTYFSYIETRIDSHPHSAKGFENYIFIENISNFSNALLHNGYNRVFRDYFKNSWGHSTEYGNSLIAENLSSHILKILKQ